VALPPKKPVEERPLTPTKAMPKHARGTRSTSVGENPGAPVAAIPVTPTGTVVPTPTAPVVPPPAKAAVPAPAAPPSPPAKAPPPKPAAPPVAKPTPPAEARAAATRSKATPPAPGAGRTVLKPVAPPAKPPTPVEFPPKELQKPCDDLLARYPSRVAALIPVLHLAQRWNGGWISPELEAGVARWLGVSDQHVRGVVTFYTMFHTKPVGRHHVQVCRTLSCWLRGAADLTDECRRRTGLSPGETDAERKFTVSEVECIGLCEVAPAIFLNDDPHVNVTRESLGRLLDGLA
jgi:NADH-quinone oxidoreductase subunit E